MHFRQVAFKLNYRPFVCWENLIWITFGPKSKHKTFHDAISFYNINLKCLRWNHLEHFQRCRHWYGKDSSHGECFSISCLAGVPLVFLAWWWSTFSASITTERQSIVSSTNSISDCKLMGKCAVQMELFIRSDTKTVKQWWMCFHAFREGVICRKAQSSFCIIRPCRILSALISNGLAICQRWYKNNRNSTMLSLFPITNSTSKIHKAHFKLVWRIPRYDPGFKCEYVSTNFLLE